MAEHGTVTEYRNGCRCTPCTVEHGEAVNRQREDRQKRLKSLPRKAHGKVSTYTNWGCRCTKCVKATAKYQLEYRERKERETKKARKAGRRKKAA